MPGRPRPGEKVQHPPILWCLMDEDAHELHRLRVIYLRRLTEELRELARTIAREDIRDEVLEVRLREVAHLRENAIHPSLANAGQVAPIGAYPLPTPSPALEAMLALPVRMRRALGE